MFMNLAWASEGAGILAKPRAEISFSNHVRDRAGGDDDGAKEDGS